MFNTYFKLGFDDNYKIVQFDHKLAEQHFGNKYIEYHCEFFRATITSIIKMWLKNGCKESPAEMADIIRQEYRGRIEINRLKLTFRSSITIQPCFLAVYACQMPLPTSSQDSLLSDWLDLG
ncbi:MULTISPECIES: TetR-like C-terminal domain-containing protein [Coprococcus]|uniref:TetR-like C-terminal domain-containing protein n=1 Tax=Coprococcus TaxID=33042 RepID=UPI001FA8C7FD|nr:MULTISPECIES: TetR-like C-terminal domain-containing protein [Coprococcus]